MKSLLLQIALLSVAFSARAQGTFIYDQQSANESTLGGVPNLIQANQPIGQTFTPTNSSVGFIRLYVIDGVAGNGLGATLNVILRTNSIGGLVLATTESNIFPDGGGGYINFFFSEPVPVTPGLSYCFQPVVQSGDSNWGIVGYNYGYLGGTMFASGAPAPTLDLWFREGIYVPEPGTWALLVVGFGVLAWRKRRFR